MTLKELSTQAMRPLLLLAVLVLSGIGTLSSVASDKQPLVSEAEQEYHDQRDRLYDANKCHQHKAQPQLSTAPDAARIASERTVRTAPSHAPGGSRSPGQLPALRKYQPDIVLHLPSGQQLSASPRRGCASCLYYVIALRHIIR